MIRRNKKTRALGTLSVSLALFGLVGCGTGLGTDGVKGQKQAIQHQAQDSHPIHLALNYVSYVSANGDPILTDAQVAKVVSEVNAIYASCGIQFELEKHQKVKPEDHGLNYSVSTLNTLDAIRAKFQDDSTFLVVNTGKWDHSGTGPANAWTAMPGEDLMGVVVDSDAASFSQIIAHELGHYLNLDHEENPSNMMNPVIYESSNAISQSQCNAMRSTANQFWGKVLRGTKN